MSRRAQRSALLCALLWLLAACGSPSVSEMPTATRRPTSQPTPRLARPTPQPTPQLTRQPTSQPTPPPDSDQPSVKLGYHYKPPGDGTSVATLAEQASFIILTKKDEPYRDQLRAAGYQGIVLHYVLANEVSGPPTTSADDDCDDSHRPFANNVADQPNDFCTLIHPNEDWFMHNGKGERLYVGDERRYYSMNPANVEWREFMLSRLKQRMFGDETMPPLGYDGIFLDNIELSLYKDLQQLDNSDGTVLEYSSDEEYRMAWVEWVAAIRKGLGTTVPLWANMISGQHHADDWNDFLPYLDGGMDESFATGYSVPSPAQYDNDLKQAEHVLAQGKGFYANAQERDPGVDLEPLALASYLLVMQPDAPIYFRYTKYDESYADWRTYPNYNVRLGAPLGPRYRIENGWRRDFTRGYVTVDPVRHIGRIVEQPPVAPAGRSER